jgi:hypothetical protein
MFREISEINELNSSLVQHHYRELTPESLPKFITSFLITELELELGLAVCLLYATRFTT